MIVNLKLKIYYRRETMKKNIQDLVKIILYLASAFFIQFAMEYIIDVKFEIYDYSDLKIKLILLASIFFTAIYFAQIGFSIYTLLIEESENYRLYYKTLLINIIQLIIIFLIVLFINMTKTDFILIVLNNRYVLYIYLMISTMFFSKTFIKKKAL